MGLFGRIKAWVESRAQEDEIRSLSDRELRDIGLSRYDAVTTHRSVFRAHRVDS